MIDPRRLDLRLAKQSAVRVGVGALAAGAAGLWAWRKLSPKLLIAPGYPGKTPHWTPSAKQAVGASLGPQSTVWFTLHHGIVTEVFFPRVDQPALARMELIVCDRDGFYSEESRDAEHSMEWLHDGVAICSLTNRCRKGRYTIEKTVFAHPDLPAPSLPPCKSPLRVRRH